jgi:cytochrome c biogenesis protein CcmG/thiol:disulfide interchange protein DsbE
MPDALETRLTRAGERLAEPPPGATARARAAALAALPAPAPRRRWTRPLGMAAGLAGAAAVAAVLVALIVATPPGDDPRQPAQASLRPDVAALGELSECSVPVPGLFVPCIEGTEPVRQATPALAGAPWLYQPAGRQRWWSVPRRPSLVFPPGTTYAEALDALVENAVLIGGLPPGTRLAPPLPDGAVLLRPRDATRGIAIDLRAPAGYSPAGFVQTIGYSGFGGVVGQGDLVWPARSRVSVPELPVCMVIRDRRARPPRCGSDDVLRSGLVRAPELPAVTMRPPVVRASLPVLRAAPGVPVTDGRVAFGDLRGRVVVATVFASWCAPCRDVAPLIRSIASGDRRRQGVTVVGIDLRDVAADGRRFARRVGYRFTLLSAPRAADVASLRLDPGLPQTLVIGKDGRMVTRLGGPVPNARFLTLAVDRALAAP